MKKSYVTPDVEKVAFQYRDQVVATSNGIITGACLANYTGAKEEGCTFSHWSGNNEKQN